MKESFLAAIVYLCLIPYSVIAQNTASQVQEFYLDYNLLRSQNLDFFRIPSGETVSYNYDPEGEYLYLASKKEICAWNLNPIKKIEKICDLESSKVAFSNDGRFIATYSPSRDRISIWETKTKAVNKEIFLADVSSITFSADGKSLACGVAHGSANGRWTSHISIIDIQRGTEKRIIGAVQDSTYLNGVIRFSKDGECVAYQYPGSTAIQLWTVETSDKLPSIKRQRSNQGIGCYSFCPTGHLIAGGTSSGVIIWDYLSGDEKVHFGAGDVFTIAYTSDGTKMLLDGSNGIQLWDLNTRSRLAAFDPYVQGQGRDTSGLLEFSPSQLGIVSGANSPIVWDLRYHMSILNSKVHIVKDELETSSEFNERQGRAIEELSRLKNEARAYLASTIYSNSVRAILGRYSADLGQFEVQAAGQTYNFKASRTQAEEIVSKRNRGIPAYIVFQMKYIGNNRFQALDPKLVDNNGSAYVR